MKKSIKVLFMFFGLICFRTDRIVAMMEAIDEYEDETSSDDLTGSGETSSTSSTGNSDSVTTTTTLTEAEILDAIDGYDDYIKSLEENGKINSMTDDEIAQYYEDYLQTLETQANSSSSTVTTSSTGGAGSAGSSTPTIGVNTGFNAPSSAPTTTAPSAPASSGGGFSFDLGGTSTDSSSGTSTDSSSSSEETTNNEESLGSGSSSTTSASGTSAVQTFAEYLESRAPGATLQSTVTTSGVNSSVTVSFEAESTSTDTQNTDTATRTGSSSDSGSVTIDTEDDQDDSQPVLFDDDDDDDTDGITNSGSAATLVNTNSETETTTTDNDAPADADAPAVEAPSAEGEADTFKDVELNEAIAEVKKNPSQQSVTAAINALKNVISNGNLTPLEYLRQFFVALGNVIDASVMDFVRYAIDGDGLTDEDLYNALEILQPATSNSDKSLEPATSDLEPATSDSDSETSDALLALADAYDTLAEEDESLQPATSDSDSETSDANIDETIKPTDSTTKSLILDEDGNTIVDFSTGTAYDEDGFEYQLGALADTLSVDSTQEDVNAAIETLQKMKSSNSTTTNKAVTFLDDLVQNITDSSKKLDLYSDTPGSLYDDEDDDYTKVEVDDDDDSQTQQSTPSLLQKVQTAINSNATLTTEIASELSSTPSLSFDRQSQVESAALIYNPTSPDYDSAANIEAAKAFLGITDSEFTITDVENARNDPSLQKYLFDTFKESSDETLIIKSQAVVDILKNSLTEERIAGGTEVEVDDDYTEVEVDDDDEDETSTDQTTSVAQTVSVVNTTHEIGATTRDYSNGTQEIDL